MRKWIVRGLLLVVVAVIVGITAFIITWSNPLAAQATAKQALQSSSTVTVTDNPNVISFVPANPVTTGLIFYPGARVAPAAYAPITRGIAEHGYAVYILKLPLNMALLGVNNARAVMDANSQIKKWAVGGHSLGGVAAASFAASTMDVKGLLLYASYPASSIADKTYLSIMSISATNDRLATAAKVDAAKPLLPQNTEYVVIQGGIHAYFGDYGPQDGDGTATISPEQQTEQTVAASLRLLDNISGK